MPSQILMFLYYWPILHYYLEVAKVLIWPRESIPFKNQACIKLVYIIVTTLYIECLRGLFRQNSSFHTPCKISDWWFQNNIRSVFKCYSKFQYQLVIFKNKYKININNTLSRRTCLINTNTFRNFNSMKIQHS